MSSETQQYPFLSDEWRDAARVLLADLRGSVLDQPGLVVNATITGVPFGTGTLELHSSHGPVVGWQPGHAADAAFAFVTDYYTAKALVLDPSATSDALSQGMEVGAVKLDGDRDQFRQWWQRRIGNTTAVDLEARLRAITF